MPEQEEEHQRNAPAKTALTPRVIAETAISLADAEGIEAVTIRKVAKELGVTPMALYWHFRNKEDLLGGIVERIYDEIDLTVDPTAPWHVQLRELLDSLVAVLRAHPAVAPLLSTRTATSRKSLQTTEVMLDILRRGGFSPVEATHVARHALGTVTNLVGDLPGMVLQEEPEGLVDVRRRARVFLESLPPEQFPRLVEAATPLTELEDPDAYVIFGLDLLLAGIEAMAARER